MRLFSLTTALLLGTTMLLTAQVRIKKVGPKDTPISDGKMMFNNYCAACHGENGKGAGPAAPALKAAVPDLTHLKAKNDGKFPGLEFRSILRGESSPAAHGTGEMPVWGPILKSASRNSDQIVELRIASLTKYLESLQAN